MWNVLQHNMINSTKREKYFAVTWYDFILKIIYYISWYNFYNFLILQHDLATISSLSGMAALGFHTVIWWDLDDQIFPDAINQLKNMLYSI